MSKIVFSEQAFEEYLYWQVQGRKVLKRLNSLLKKISHDPFSGLGKPEGLKENLFGPEAGGRGDGDHAGQGDGAGEVAAVAGDAAAGSATAAGGFPEAAGICGAGPGVFTGGDGVVRPAGGE